MSLAKPLYVEALNIRALCIGKVGSTWKVLVIIWKGRLGAYLESNGSTWKVLPHKGLYICI